MSRSAFDASNFTLRPLTALESAVDLWSDDSFTVHSLILPGLHSDFAFLVDLNRKEGDANVASDYLKSKFSGARTKFMTV